MGAVKAMLIGAEDEFGIPFPDPTREDMGEDDDDRMAAKLSATIAPSEDYESPAIDF